MAEEKASDAVKPFKPAPAHEFVGVTEWLNAEQPPTMAEQKGRVVVIHFYAADCINCIHNLPHYQKWQDDFGGKDFTVIGVHTPETAVERQAAHVRAKAKASGITYPVAIDADSANWKKWGCNMWPTCGLIDRKGMLRYFWEGELNWKEQKGEAFMRGKIEELLAEGSG